MDYEKKYKEALERAKKYKMQCDLIITQDIFPELKESEDEKVRKALIEYFNEQCDMSDWNGVYGYQVVDWLKKQGKQKPTYMFEPKFKVGDWITNREHSYLIADIDYEQGRYLFEIGGYTHEQLNWEYIKNADEKYHLWTIEDAKDGDVLYSPCLKLLWIFKSRDTVYCGCNLNYNDGAFFGKGYFERPTDATPATKEQRDLLFSKIKEAGYEWDADKKELKKISQRMVSAEAKEAIYDKPAWSEEDEAHINGIIDYLLDYKLLVYEEDMNVANGAQKELDWLKSLKDIYTWKPSDEQIVVLELASKYERVFTPKQISVLIDLKEQLKKLKGE